MTLVVWSWPVRPEFPPDVGPLCVAPHAPLHSRPLVAAAVPAIRRYPSAAAPARRVFSCRPDGSKKCASNRRVGLASTRARFLLRLPTPVAEKFDPERIKNLIGELETATDRIPR